MTFDEIVSDVAGRLNLTTPDAITRIGLRVNRRYRRIAVSIGLITLRREVNSFSVVAGLRDQDIPGEKVLSITLAGQTRPIDAMLFNEMQETVPTTGAPRRWAVKRQNASTVTVRFDSTMDSGQDMTVEVEAAGSTLVGSAIPAFPESWHDILVYGALSDELNKKEKTKLGNDAEATYATMLSELRLHIAVNGYVDQQQGKKNLNGRMSSSGNGGAASATSGTVTHVSSGLTLNQLIVGNAGADIKPLGSAGTTVQVLHGNAAGLSAFGPVVEADLGLTDITTANVSTTKHGLAPKAPNDATQFLNGVGAYAVPSDASKAPLASPALTGNPTAPTAAPGDNDTSIATTAFVTAAAALKANLASPVLTGNPTAPTPAVGDNDTSVATTAFVQDADKVKLIRGASGTNAAAGATNVDTAALSGLTALDVVEIRIHVVASAQPCAGIAVFDVTDGTTLGTVTAGLSANETLVMELTLRVGQGSNTIYALHTRGNGTVLGAMGTVIVTAGLTSWLTGVTIGFRHLGVTAGGTLQWSWSVHRRVGQ